MYKYLLPAECVCVCVFAITCKRRIIYFSRRHLSRGEIRRRTTDDRRFPAHCVWTTLRWYIIYIYIYLLYHIRIRRRLIKRLFFFSLSLSLLFISDRRNDNIENLSVLHILLLLCFCLALFLCRSLPLQYYMSARARNVNKKENSRMWYV
jgi:hypothetical protein